MCGIAGIVNWGTEETLRRMTQIQYHRGPDDFGYYRINAVQLGHRRLSIIDIAGGKQPMHSDDGVLTIVFNGEIYNFKELRDILLSKGHRFKTASDTEVLLRLFEASCATQQGGPKPDCGDTPR